MEIQVVSELDTCMRYLMLNEPDEHNYKKTEDEIAQALLLQDASALRARVIEWHRTGTMKEAYRRQMIYNIEKINLMALEVLKQTPAMIQRQLKIATEGRSDGAATEAYKQLMNTFVLPGMNSDTTPAAAELEYIESQTASGFNPTDV